VNIALWIVQALLALALLASGTPKTFGGKAKLMQDPKMTWAQDFPDSTVRFIGLAEIAAALGLIAAPLLGVWMWSVVSAAAGVMALMAGAAVVHLRRNENQAIAVNIVFILLAAFVVYGRIVEPLHA